MELNDEDVLLAQKPLYGVPESGRPLSVNNQCSTIALHWLFTYPSHHVKSLSMHATKGDICVLYQTDIDGNDAVTAVQVCDCYRNGR